MFGIFQGALGPLPLRSLQPRAPCSFLPLSRGIGAPRGPPLSAFPTALWPLSFRQNSHHPTRGLCNPEGPPPVTAGTPKGPEGASGRAVGGRWWGPYASLVRLHAPIGTWLLYWPCVFSITLATPVSAASATAEAARAATALPSVATLLAAAAWGASKEEEGADNQQNQQQQEPQQLQQQQQEEEQRQQEQQQEGDWLPGVLLDSCVSLFLCGVGAFLMRSAGCIINDMWDRSLDKRVERTRGRPLASGALGVGRALGALGALFLPSLYILMQFNLYTVCLGLSSLFFVALYPAMKRLISLPQLFLGFTFNWGALLGWAALLGPQGMPACLGGAPSQQGPPAGSPAAVEAPVSFTAGTDRGGAPSARVAAAGGGPSLWGSLLPIEWVPVCLYLGCALWTLTYDTLYAFQDIKDDKKVGIKSSAVTWGPQGARLWGSLSVLAQGALWGLAGAPLGAPGPYYVGIATCCAWLANLLWKTDLNDRAACGRAFKTSHRIGALFAASIVASKILEYIKGPPGAPKSVPAKGEP